MASVIDNPFRFNAELTPALGEFIIIPSFASKLSSETSQPSIRGLISKLKCLANA